MYIVIKEGWLQIIESQDCETITCKMLEYFGGKTALNRKYLNLEKYGKYKK